MDAHYYHRDVLFFFLEAATVFLKSMKMLSVASQEGLGMTSLCGSRKCLNLVKHTAQEVFPPP